MVYNCMPEHAYSFKLNPGIHQAPTYRKQTRTPEIEPLHWNVKLSYAMFTLEGIWLFYELITEVNVSNKYKLKTVKVIPVYKNRDKEGLGKYGPISLMQTSSRY